MSWILEICSLWKLQRKRIKRTNQTKPNCHLQFYSHAQRNTSNIPEECFIAFCVNRSHFSTDTDNFVKLLLPNNEFGANQCKRKHSNQMKHLLIRAKYNIACHCRNAIIVLMLSELGTIIYTSNMAYLMGVTRIKWSISNWYDSMESEGMHASCEFQKHV